MKNVTLSAEAQLIEQARLIARSRHTTLNAEFREWLQHYTSRTTGPADFDHLMRRLGHIRAGRSFTREERNER